MNKLICDLLEHICPTDRVLGEPLFYKVFSRLTYRRFFYSLIEHVLHEPYRIMYCWKGYEKLNEFDSWKRKSLELAWERLGSSCVAGQITLGTLSINVVYPWC